jgi:predicted DNA-binding transcriptional regulator YafY
LRSNASAPPATLNRTLADSYGIFAGTPVATAVLVFNAKRARWVADEQWHPRQQNRWLEDGRYELRVPYSDDRELVMDILKYGADVEVVAPAALRGRIESMLEAAAMLYRRGKARGSEIEPENE